MRKLSTIAAPAVAGCVRERTVRAAIAEIKNCYYDGSTFEQLDLRTVRAVVDNTRKLL